MKRDKRGERRITQPNGFYYITIVDGWSIKTYPLDTWSSGPEPKTVSSGEVIRCSISRLFGLKAVG